MSNLFTYLSEGQSQDHTPGTAMTGGQLILLSGKRPAISTQPIAASVLGSVRDEGRWSGPYVGGVCNVGDNLWWDANGTPYGGAANGALTNIGADGDWWVGVVTAAPAATDAVVEFDLNVQNSNQPNWFGRTYLKSAIDITMVEATHSGGVIEITADAKTVTLPIGVVGMEHIIINRVADGGSLLTVDLNGNEIIRGMNLTIAATKTANNTKLTQVMGDWVHLVCTVAATAWRCVGIRGGWVTS